ncbi:Cation/H+ exchanger [Microdochium trichocladiopsis]|uniref:Cation/H+ exchanger n=1 Tax=Microdochium trichocladiopsis TaxID=1682393 RepID=A0A9P8Y041_9PEZI|nr:Cation/H+ exchanger [Microdochium trichocladiopsis]KAH7024808.1 Cation/H+ exchanger [Microdochium trichocladiopsis]
MAASTPHDPETKFNIVCCAIGGFIGLFGLVSFLLKESFFVSEPLISLAAGVALSPFGFDLVRPRELAGAGHPTDPAAQQEAVETATLCFARLVLGVQVLIAGVRLPSKYPRREWRSLAVLLGPGMLGMWAATSLLVWLVVPGIDVAGALAIGACMTPTDPVLSNSIVQGPFADRHMPEPLQMIIVGESGANDGLGYLFVYLPLYLVNHAREDDGSQVGNAVLAFLGMTLGRQVVLGVVYGAAVGWGAKYVLYWSERKNYVDTESFQFFVIALALFVIGTAGLLDVNDILACFVAGVLFTWDDWFTEQTKNDTLQPIMDFLLSVTVFMWLGAVCPWDLFFNATVMGWPRLLILAILVLLFRRVPVILALHTFIPQIRSVRHALIMGFFGPIGISAIFYVYTIREFLRPLAADGREDCRALADQTLVVVWFLVFSSVVVHGLAIPLGTLATSLPQVIRQTKTVLGGEEIDNSRAAARQQQEDGQHPERGERRPLLGQETDGRIDSA